MPHLNWSTPASHIFSFEGTRLPRICQEQTLGHLLKELEKWQHLDMAELFAKLVLFYQAQGDNVLFANLLCSEVVAFYNQTCSDAPFQQSIGIAFLAKAYLEEKYRWLLKL